MSKTTTLIFTCNEVRYFPEGYYGDGRVAIHVINPSECSDRRAVAFDLCFKSGFVETLEGDVFDKAYIYVGRLTEDRSSYLNVCLRVAAGLIEDRAMIHLISCDCGADKVQPYCQKYGFTFIPCECRGVVTLQKIVEKILGEAGVEVEQ